MRTDRDYKEIRKVRWVWTWPNGEEGIDRVSRAEALRIAKHCL